MKNKTTARKVMLALCSVSAALCVVGAVLIFVMDRGQTALLRRILFTVAMVLLESTYVVRLIVFRDTKKDIAISAILCAAVAALIVFLWII